MKKNIYKIGNEVYIISDKDIKEGDSIFEADTNTINVAGKDYIKNEFDFKIILTTDETLIKDEIQEIDKEFLEWLAKNPNCDYIPTPIVKLCENCGEQFCDNIDCRGYIDKPYYLLAYPDVITKKTFTYVSGYKVNSKEVEPKKETIEEIEKLAFQKRAELGLKGTIDGFIAGYKLAQEQ
jgi:hypothetical protein